MPPPLRLKLGSFSYHSRSWARQGSDGLPRDMPTPLKLGSFSYQEMHRDTASQLKQRVLHCVECFHRDTPKSLGVELDSMRQQIQMERPVLDQVLARLKGDGQLAEKNGRWALPSHAAEFQGEDANTVAAIDKLFRDRAFHPPNVDKEG